MKTKTLQLHSLEGRGKNKATPEQIVDFLETFRLLQNTKPKESSKLISIKVNSHLLNAFRLKADQEGIPYQTKIKELMQPWL